MMVTQKDNDSGARSAGAVDPDTREAIPAITCRLSVSCFCWGVLCTTPARVAGEPLGPMAQRALRALSGPRGPSGPLGRSFGPILGLGALDSPPKLGSAKMVEPSFHK